MSDARNSKNNSPSRTKTEKTERPSSPHCKPACDLRLRNAEKTIANKDVIIKMLQDHVRKLEETYKQNLKETESYRYKFCQASEQIKRLRTVQCNRKGSEEQPDSPTEKCCSENQIQKIEEIVKAHYQLLQSLAEKMAEKDSEGNKECAEQIVLLQKEIGRLQDENIKLSEELKLQKDPLIPRVRDSIIETYRKTNEELQKKVSHLMVLSNTSYSTDDEDVSETTSDTAGRRVSFMKQPPHSGVGRSKLNVIKEADKESLLKEPGDDDVATLTEQHLPVITEAADAVDLSGEDLTSLFEDKNKENQVRVTNKIKDKKEETNILDEEKAVEDAEEEILTVVEKVHTQEASTMTEEVRVGPQQDVGCFCSGETVQSSKRIEETPAAEFVEDVSKQYVSRTNEETRTNPYEHVTCYCSGIPCSRYIKKSNSKIEETSMGENVTETVKSASKDSSSMNQEGKTNPYEDVICYCSGIPCTKYVSSKKEETPISKNATEIAEDSSLTKPDPYENSVCYCSGIPCTRYIKKSSSKTEETPVSKNATEIAEKFSFTEEARADPYRNAVCYCSGIPCTKYISGKVEEASTGKNATEKAEVSSLTQETKPDPYENSVCYCSGIPCTKYVSSQVEDTSMGKIATEIAEVSSLTQEAKPDPYRNSVCSCGGISCTKYIISKMEEASIDKNSIEVAEEARADPYRNAVCYCRGITCTKDVSCNVEETSGGKNAVEIAEGSSLTEETEPAPHESAFTEEAEKISLKDDLNKKIEELNQRVVELSETQASTKKEIELLRDEMRNKECSKNVTKRERTVESNFEEYKAIIDNLTLMNDKVQTELAEVKTKMESLCDNFERLRKTAPSNDAATNDAFNHESVDISGALEEENNQKLKKIKCINDLISFYKKVNQEMLILNGLDEHSKKCICGDLDVHSYMEKVKSETFKLKTTISSTIYHLNKKLAKLNDKSKDSEANVEIEDIYNFVRTSANKPTPIESSTSCLCRNAGALSSQSCTCDSSALHRCGADLPLEPSSNLEDIYASVLCMCKSGIYGPHSVPSSELRCELCCSLPRVLQCSDKKSGDVEVVDPCSSSDRCLVVNLENYVGYLYEQLNIITCIENRIQDLRCHIKGSPP